MRAAVALPRPRHMSIPLLDALEAADRMVGRSFTGVECHRHGSSVVKRPVKILYSCRLRGSSLFEQIEESLGLVSMRAAVDLFEWRAIIGSAAS